MHHPPAAAHAAQVIFCAAARSTLSADLTRVDERGVVNIVKALQDEFIRVTRRNAGAGASSSGTGNKSIGRNRIFSQRTKKEIADFSEVRAMSAVLHSATRARCASLCCTCQM